MIFGAVRQPRGAPVEPSQREVADHAGLEPIFVRR
jgi:hypothetical protein